MIKLTIQWAFFGLSIYKELIFGDFCRESYAVADPGFPVGGRAPVRGGMDLRRGHFLVKMYAKTKELGPIGGHAPGTPCPPPPPRSTNAMNYCKLKNDGCQITPLKGTF